MAKQLLIDRLFLLPFSRHTQVRQEFSFDMELRDEAAIVCIDSYLHTSIE
jgi:hypothetical protein